MIAGPSTGNVHLTLGIDRESQREREREDSLSLEKKSTFDEGPDNHH